MSLQKLNKILKHISAMIDNGTCGMTDEEADVVFEQFSALVNGRSLMSKYEAAKFLGVSRAKFDRMVADGRVPQGEKRAGIKELLWDETELTSVKKQLDH